MNFRSAKKRYIGLENDDFWDQLAKNDAPRDAIWDPWKIQNRSKIAFLRLDFEFGLQKWPPRGSRETPRKIHENFIKK